MTKSSSMHSKFLPEDFQKGSITLIAGKGRYPSLLAEQIRAHKLPINLISLIDQTDAHLINTFDSKQHVAVPVGQLKQLLKAIKNWESPYVVLAGQIKPVKLFKGLNPDLKVINLLAKIKTHNAETIFGAVVAEIEALGAQVIDARSFLDEHIATHGSMTQVANKVSEEFIQYGIEIAKQVAHLNIGQGIVIRKKTIVAVEAFEGTDKMLQRAGEFKTDGLIFIKTIKDKQDFRFDIPVFGMKTLDVMIESNIRTAVLEADKLLMIDKDAIIEKAQKNKIQLIGFKASDYR